MESLVALSVLVMITSLILTQINHQRQLVQESLHQEEVLSVGTMAVQSHQDHLTLNSITVEVKRSSQAIRVYESGKEVMHVANQTC